MKLCLSCKKNVAVSHPTYGLIPCVDCRSGSIKPKPIEVVPNRIKEDRKEHSDATVQPFHKGVLNKRYYELYQDRYIKIDKTDLKKMKYTGDSYYKQK